MKVVISTEKVSWESNEFGSSGENEAERDDFKKALLDKYGDTPFDEERAYFSLRLAEPGYRQLMDIFLDGSDSCTVAEARVLLYLLHRTWDHVEDDSSAMARIVHAATLLNRNNRAGLLATPVKFLFGPSNPTFFGHWGSTGGEKTEDEALTAALIRRFCYNKQVGQLTMSDKLTEQLVDNTDWEAFIGLARECKQLHLHASAYEIGTEWYGVYRPLRVVETSMMA